MKSESLLLVAETLRANHHQHLGITAYPPAPLHSPPAIRLEHADIPSFSNAIDFARDHWPVDELCLIGSHGAVGTTNMDDPAETLPVGFLHFLDPEILVRIPVADPEDQADQID